MDVLIFQQSVVIFLCLLLGSGTSIREKPPPEAIQRTRLPEKQETRKLISDPDSNLDTTPTSIPIVQPSDPGSTPPVDDSPPAPFYTDPTITPTTPITTPTTPTTTPTTPFTTPITTPTTPITTPITTPTTPVTTPITTPTTPTTTPSTTGGSWCIASSSASETALQVALDYACGYGGADCSAVQASGSCYNPNTLRDHASYAFNDYYHKNPAPTSCVFGGAAQLTTTDPSTGSCRFPSSTGTTSTTPSPFPPTTTPPSPDTTPPAPTLTPMTPTLTPMTPTPPGSTYDGLEPTGLPSSATSLSCTQLIIFVGLAAWFYGANHE